MTTPYNVTALAGRLLREEVAADAPIAEDSLNAGINPLDSDIDNRVIEVAAPLPLIEQQLKSNDIELGDEITPVAEALVAAYDSMTYLRDDMIRANGMSQKLAQEALNIKPTFGRGRPLNHYSRTPTQTYYRMSMEELDGDIKANVVAYLATVAESIAQAQARLKGSQIDCQDRYDILSNAMSSFTQQFATLEETVRDVGLNWNEKEFLAEQTKHMPVGLLGDPSTNSFIRKMVDRDDYFFTMCYARYLTEAGRAVMNNWVADLEKITEGSEGMLKKSIDAVEPKSPKVTMYGGKSIDLANAEKYLYDLSMKDAAKEKEPLPFKLVLSGLAASMSENELPSTIQELQLCHEGLERIRTAVVALRDRLVLLSPSDAYHGIVQKYATDLMKFVEGFAHGTLGAISYYVSTWKTRAVQAVAFGMYMVEGADCMVKVYAPAELQTGEDLRNRWREQIEGLRNAAAVILNDE